MDYHSVITPVSHMLALLAITPTAAGILVFAACLLLILSFFVAGSEVAFFSLSTKDINLLKARKQPSFRRIVHLMEHPKPLLTAMLIASWLANIGFILILHILLDNWMKDLPITSWGIFFIKVGIVSFVLILFAEVLPKIWATHKKIWFAATASLVIEIINSIFYRLSRRLVVFSDSMERKVTSQNSSTMDESHIDYAIDLLPEHEATPEEKQILKGIRKFGGTSVKQIMRTRMDVNGIEINYTFPMLVKKVEDLQYSRLPVYRGNLDEIAGMLHTKDLLPHINEATDFDWSALIRPPYFVHEQKLIEDLLQDFRAKRIHFAIVVDEFGGTSGIVTLEDIMEEIIGEIEDEFDDEQSANKKIDEYNYIFEGKTMINDVCKAMKIPTETFEDSRGESDSLAGLLLEIAGEFPQVNDELVNGRFTFVPLEINKNRIDKVKVIIQSPHSEKASSVK